MIFEIGDIVSFREAEYNSRECGRIIGIDGDHAFIRYTWKNDFDRIALDALKPGNPTDRRLVFLGDFTADCVLNYERQDFTYKTRGITERMKTLLKHGRSAR